MVTTALFQPASNAVPSVVITIASPTIPEEGFKLSQFGCSKRSSSPGLPRTTEVNPWARLLRRHRGKIDGNLGGRPIAFINRRLKLIVMLARAV